MRIVDNLGKNYVPLHEGEKYLLKRETLGSGLQYVDIYFDEWDAYVGEPGYYVIADYEKLGSYLCFFKEKEEKELMIKQNLMPILGVKNNQGTFLMIVHGMKSAFYVSVGMENGVYRIAARFQLDQELPYEDISFSVVDLGKDAEYSDMAVYYRNYQLKFGGCIPLEERISSNSYLSYAAESVQIRIRMGWKPAPPTVLEQTRESEPEMLAACSFDRVKDLIDELKVQGVDKAELCLVGWNKSGHDGRWPEMFPVEESLGGETKLRELITYAQEKGYQITCHTNSTDCYHIAEDFCEDIVVKKRDGSLSADELAWSGGRMYHLCPHKAMEFVKRDLPKVANLGFKGIHYIDVMSVVPLRKCYDPNHLATPADTEKIYREIGNYSKELFGGFSSEGAFDFAADYLDYALYVSFGSSKENFFDREIPLWQIVYHGIVLSNPSTETVNYPIKAAESHLKLIEYGGRPTFYFYSKFMTNSNLTDWLGKEDLGCGTDEELREAVKNIRIAYEEYKQTRYLQQKFITEHSYKNGIAKISYSDGSVIEVDYNTGIYKRERY